MPFHTIIEPFRIKSVEALKFTHREDRVAALEAAGCNVFLLHADDVLIDLLTDSGTGAMSSAQWGALMQGDESYAGSRSFYRFRDVVQALTGFTHIIPTHQGRAAERILFHTTLSPGQIVPNNNHFDTTRANIEVEGAEARGPGHPRGARAAATAHPFKGNIDLAALERLLARARRPRAARDGDGHQQLRRRTARVAREPARPCARSATATGSRSSSTRAASPRTPGSSRCARPGRRHRTPRDIAREMFSLADGCTMSAKKDGLANIGGFLAMNDDGVGRARAEPADPDRGLPHLRRAGRLRPRGDRARARGGRRGAVPALPDPLDGVPRREADGRRRADHPAAGRPRDLHRRPRAAAAHPAARSTRASRSSNALYVEAGIRGVEIGTVMFGRHAGRHRDAGGDGPRAPRHPAARLHAVAHRLRGRGGHLSSRAARSARGLPDRQAAQPCCGTSPRGSRGRRP